MYHVLKSIVIFRLGVLKVCRDIQCLLSEERERALSTAHFARTVSKHLYHNIVFRDHRRNIYVSFTDIGYKTVISLRFI